MISLWQSCRPYARDFTILIVVAALCVGAMLL